MAKRFWQEQTQDMPGWKLVEKLDSKPKTQDELILYIAKDLDYRVAKATAKYLFGRTSKSAGDVLINPDETRFSAVKFQFRDTYYRLDNEFTYK
ncbi:hypothetical protein [Peptoclostridium acidaminophilum]|uniref:hypothetical protein n=1 Tax=Peptoclostridium acidaminophilum TaxID=1731 RepID=UPI00046CB39C|nr:hypothetical protein [Peptoclostridium acidaminophilum]